MNAPSPTDTDRRTAILDAAVESFGKLGYYGTSFQRIATEVGLTKAGVLHYVGSTQPDRRGVRTGAHPLHR